MAGKNKAGGQRKPQGKQKPGRPKPGPKPGKSALGKRMAEARPTAPAPADAAKDKSGDVDDFEFMLGEMPDYEAPQDESEGEGAELGGGLEAAGEPAKASEGAAAAAAAAEGGGSGEEGEQQPKKKRKKQRKKGPKASALEFEASRALAAEIADGSAADQADWLWHSFQQHSGASSLEREGITAGCIVQLSSEGSLEDRLKELEPNGAWKARFCNGGGGGGGGGKGAGKGGQEGEKGAPALLLVSPAAMGAIKLMKHCPEFHKACRIAKLFAKHIKVPEQQQLLASSVVCVGAGTPNRIAKLADLEALKLGRLKYVVLDTSLDAKQRTILDIPETRGDWWELFSRHLRPLLAAGQAKLALVNSDKLA